ncbi:aminotransferase class IV [Rufibacter sp. DG15C]|uniref:aminotransferase class IV n=1 Tax=Rufibacter sp. DG15C TaxID=1379909 RepID=UPI0008360573|nr:aminotransferase class IV [Rufibacter sp. DG15C]
MYLNYNGHNLPENELVLPLTNRAFQYNDGFFETMVLVCGDVRFLAEHGERMREAAAVLRLELPDDLQPVLLGKAIQELALKNNCAEFARVKLKVWRGGEGLYTPQTNAVEWLLTAEAMTPSTMEPVSIGISTSVYTHASLFSSFKGPNSPVYVLASLEKKERQLEDLLLLDTQGHISELTYSNIFWVEGNTLFTPSLDTGCLNGVMRRNLLKKAAIAHWNLEEGKFLPEVLHQAELVFSSNVMGLRPIQVLEGKPLPLNLKLLEDLRQLAFR